MNTTAIDTVMTDGFLPFFLKKLDEKNLTYDDKKTLLNNCFRNFNVIFDSSMKNYTLVMSCLQKNSNKTYCAFGKISMNSKKKQSICFAATVKRNVKQLEDAESKVVQPFYFDNLFWDFWPILDNENFKEKLWKKNAGEDCFDCYEEKYVQYDPLDNPLQGDILHKKSKVRATVQGGQTTVTGQNPATTPNTKTEAEEYFDEATQNQQNAEGKTSPGPANGTENANGTDDGEPPDMSEKIKNAIVIFDNSLWKKNFPGFNFIINFKDKSYLLGRVNGDKTITLFNELDKGELKQETQMGSVPVVVSDFADVLKILDFEAKAGNVSKRENWIWKKKAGETKFRCFEKK